MTSFFLRPLFLVLGWVSLVQALTIQPEISIELAQLPQDKRGPLLNLEERLAAYISDYDWDEDEQTLGLTVPLAIQLTNVSEEGANTVYQAKVACSNGGDLRIDESDWKFTVDAIGAFRHQENQFDSFLGMVDYCVLMVIASEYDKLGEFAGDAMYEKVRRVLELAQFSTYRDGWSDRYRKLDQVTLAQENRPYRTLRWVMHTAIWFRQVMDNDYEAWTTTLTALDLATEIDDQTKLSTFWDANYRIICEILVKARDEESILRLLRLDTSDPQRRDHYLQQAGQAAATP